MRSCLFAITILLASLVKAQAAQGLAAELPFEFREGFLWVEVAVPQSPVPLHFLLDTGAAASVINLSTAKRLGLKLGRPVTVYGVETNLAGYWPQRIHAHAGTVELPGNYLAADLEALSKACERPVDGLIGADFFRKRVVQIDFQTHTLRLLAHGTGRSTNECLPLQTRSCGMRVAITVEGRPNQWVRLDTGCATPLQWVTTEVRPDQCARKPGIGLSALLIAQTQTTVLIGRHEFKNVPTGLHDAAIFPGEAGLLGNGLLSRFASITIDSRAGCLVLAARSEP